MKLRAAGRVGLAPAKALALAGGVLAVGLVVALATGQRGSKLADDAMVSIDGGLAALGFKLDTIQLQGASKPAQAEILAAAGLHRNQPIFGLDLEALRARVQQVSWVKQAHVIRLLPSTLVIAVDERRMLAVWQRAGRLSVIDGDGVIVARAKPERFGNLPLVVGAGADQAAAAILPAVQSRPRLAARLEALVRVDDRRWDLRLKDGGLIQLPASGEEAALIRLDQLDAASRILELGFARIDLRAPEMVAVRPRQSPAPGLMVGGV